MPLQNQEKTDRRPGHPPLEPGRTRVVRSVSLRGRDDETIRMAADAGMGGRSAVIRKALDLLRATLRA